MWENLCELESQNWYNPEKVLELQITADNDYVGKYPLVECLRKSKVENDLLINFRENVSR